MFEWLFRNRDDKVLKDLIKVLKDGITIKIIISDNIDAQERGNSLEEKKRIIQSKIKQNQKGPRKEEISDPIPNFSNLQKPKVNFGEEKEA